MKPAIRRMVAADKQAIMQVLHLTPEFEPEEVVVAEELIDSYLDDPATSGYRILVADTNSKPVGYICYGNTPLTKGTWDVYWLAVASTEQSKGVGKALLSSAEDDIAKSQGRLIFIETSSKPGYKKTRRFYKARGYEIVCRIADFYAPGDGKIVFQKCLIQSNKVY